MLKKMKVPTHFSKKYLKRVFEHIKFKKFVKDNNRKFLNSLIHNFNANNNNKLNDNFSSAENKINEGNNIFYKNDFKDIFDKKDTDHFDECVKKIKLSDDFSDIYTNNTEVNLSSFMYEDLLEKKENKQLFIDKSNIVKQVHSRLNKINDKTTNFIFSKRDDIKDKKQSIRDFVYNSNATNKKSKKQTEFTSPFDL